MSICLKHNQSYGYGDYCVYCGLPPAPKVITTNTTNPVEPTEPEAKTTDRNLDHDYDHCNCRNKGYHNGYHSLNCNKSVVEPTEGESTQPEKWEEEFDSRFGWLYNHAQTDKGVAHDFDYEDLKLFIRRVRSQALTEGGPEHCPCDRREARLAMCKSHYERAYGSVAAPQRECCGECIFHHSFSKHCRDTNCPCHTPKEEKCDCGNLHAHMQQTCYVHAVKPVQDALDALPPIVPIEPKDMLKDKDVILAVRSLENKINEIIRALNHKI